jgi:hypothetical protein
VDATVRADAGDEISAFARTADDVEGTSTDMEQLCRELRQRHPAKDLTLEAANEKPLLSQFKRLTVSDEILEIVKENKKDTSSFSEDDRLAFDRSIEKCDFIYLEHLRGAEDTEIKWYAGPVKAAASAKYSACKISDFLKSCPAMGEILLLPEGWLVVVRNNSVEAAFNADDKLVGRTATGESA